MLNDCPDIYRKGCEVHFWRRVDQHSLDFHEKLTQDSADPTSTVLHGHRMKHEKQISAFVIRILSQYLLRDEDV